MAPFAENLPRTIIQHAINDHSDGLPPGLTTDRLIVLEVVSLTLATVSISASLVAFYWFVRMRRSFRQDLIMLLIQGDTLKAFWLLLCPLVYFGRGSRTPLSSTEPFCQISGFFLTVAVEASDIAVLMIAIHSGLFILKPHGPGGETGLYLYRRYAYGIWIVVPLILACVAPITGTKFEDLGSHCYLPVHPLWFRLALSWIPRYIIFGIVVITYSWVYIFIWLRYRRIQQAQRRASTNSGLSISKRRHKPKQRCRDTPPTPKIAEHGLLDSPPPPPPPGEVTNSDTRDRHMSITSTVSTLKLDDRQAILPALPNPVQRGSVSWNWVEMNYEGSSRNPPRRERVSILQSPSPSPTKASFRTETPDPKASLSESSHQPSIVSPRPMATTSNTFRNPPDDNHQDAGNRTATSSTRRMSSILQSARFHHRPNRVDTDANYTSTSSDSVYLTQSATEDSLQKSRDKMRRQLRLLFVYPVMYIITWIAPFISQVLRYDDGMGDPQPFELLIASVASLCIGAAVDCCFFCAWEEPWRHLRNGFWEGLTQRIRIGNHKHMGRTREEEERDARNALERRERETYEARITIKRTRPRRRPREWWDVIEEGREEYLPREEEQATSGDEGETGVPWISI